MFQMRTPANAQWLVSYEDRPLHTLPSRAEAKGLVERLAAGLERVVPLREAFREAMRAWERANRVEDTGDLCADEHAWWCGRQAAGEQFLRERGCADDTTTLAYWALAAGGLPSEHIPTTMLFSIAAITPYPPHPDAG